MSFKKLKIKSIKNLNVNQNRYDLTIGQHSRYLANGILVHNTDGQNVWATIQNGEVKFARNKGESITPMTLSQFKQKFQDHPSETVRDTFQFAAEDLANLLIKLPKKTQDEIFDNGKNFMNMELIYSRNPNVINYDTDVIQFHNITKTDGNGTVLGTDAKPAKEIPSILSKLKANLGKTFQIIPPRIIQLQQDLDFTENRNKFIKKVDDLQNRYGLSDNDEVSRYHEMWWMELIDKEFPGLDSTIKEGLLKRWAYDDKKSLDIRSLEKTIGKAESDKIKKFDKDDVKKRFKENIRPFEDLFLELGSIILKNASNFVAANPSKEAQRLRSHLAAEAERIKSTGGPEQIMKVEAELDRLNRIGGLESIYPTEGLVFRYNGKLYKLTGTFAALNQLLGIIKYGR